MYSVFYYFILSLVFSILFTPLAIKLGYKLTIVAVENHRTIHVGQIPRTGGFAILLSVAVSLVAARIFEQTIFENWGWQLGTLLTSSFLLFTLGTIDDKFDINNNLKMLIEALIVTGTVLAGWRIEAIVFPTYTTIHLGVFSIPITILWIVGIINALNMIDGLDGLAAGIVFVVSFFTALLAALFGNYPLIFLAVIITASVLGFIKYNKYPASIFMGDSGSLPLGFLMACLSFKAATVVPGKIAFIIPVLLLAVPITDTILSIVRRLSRRIHPFTPDQEHIHHRLVKLGLSHSGTVLLLVGLTFILCLIAFLFAYGMKTEMDIIRVL